MRSSGKDSHHVSPKVKLHLQRGRSHIARSLKGANNVEGAQPVSGKRKMKLGNVVGPFRNASFRGLILRSKAIATTTAMHALIGTSWLSKA
jgi:hypothetical protein